MNAGIKLYVSKFMRLNDKWQRVAIQGAGMEGVSDFLIFGIVGERNNTRCAKKECILDGHNFVLT